MSDVYFISDLHLGHKKLANLRGFNSIEEHDCEIVNSIKQTITKRDSLWVIGDVVWNAVDIPSFITELASIMPLNKVTIVGGNHDKNKLHYYHHYGTNIEAVVKFKGLWVSHIPVHPQEMIRAIGNIHGHIHKFGVTNPLPLPYFNVNWDYVKKPVSLQRVRQLLQPIGA